MERCLPLSPQDLCLLVVINDLDVYPVSLLASLPCWFRHRLPRNLPLIDLCLPDHSPVARGIDINEIWKNRYRSRTSRKVYGEEYSQFELPMERWRWSGRARVCSAREVRGLDSKLVRALQSLPRSPGYGKYSYRVSDANSTWSTPCQ